MFYVRLLATVSAVANKKISDSVTESLIYFVKKPFRQAKSLFKNKCYRQGCQSSSRFEFEMRELWGSITTEEQTQRCRRMAVLSNFISNININIISLIFGELVFLLSCFPQSAYPGCLSSCSSVVYLGTLHRHKTKFSSCYASLSSTFIIKQALIRLLIISESL